MKTTISLAMVGLAVTLSGPATAQDVMGGYIGASMGEAKAKSACEGLAPSSCDEKDTAWKVYGGYRFHRYFGVELGYTDLGETNVAGIQSGVPITRTTEAKAVEFTLVGTVPLNEHFSVYGKAGLFRWDVDANANIGGVPVALDDKGTNFTYGIGMHYHFNRNIAIRGEWQRYNQVGDQATTGRSDVNMISVGVVFGF